MNFIKNKKYSSRKVILFTIIPLLVIGVLATVTVYALNRDNNTESASTPESQEVIKENQVTGDESKPGVTEENATDSKTQSPQPTTPSTGTLPTPRILSAYQEGSTIRVSADFNELASGTCVLRLFKDGEDTVELTANIIIVPSGYACNGFTTTVPSYGGWQASITHINGDQKSIEVTKTVE